MSSVPRAASKSGGSENKFPAADEYRILILAPTGNDAGLARKLLGEAGFQTHVCPNLGELCKTIRRGCGAVVLAEEALSFGRSGELAKIIAQQPPWSDLSIAIATTRGDGRQPRLQLGALELGSNVTLLERPFHPNTLISVAEVALRARRRQYQTRDLLQEMQISEERFRTLASHAPVGIFQSDIQGNAIFVNEGWCAMLGCRAEEALGRGWLKMVHPDDRERIQVGWEEAIAKNISSKAEFRFINRSGKVIWVEGNAIQLKTVKNVPFGYIGTVADITERRQKEDAFRRLAAIVEYSHDAIISKDLDGIIITWNKGAEKIFGYQAAEMIGKSVTVLIPADRQSEEPDILARLRRGEYMDDFETVRKRKDGTLVNISLTISPIMDAGGKIIGISKIARDISERKRIEEELTRVHSEVLAASRAKDDFLATLSHELRTPLNPALLIASDAARNPELSPRVRTDFDMIRKSIELEARLIDDLLDLTRITRGKLLLNLSEVEVLAILRDAITTVQEEIEQKRIHLELALHPVTSHVMGDAVRLQQVFWNVLKNAVKFTPEGGKITVEMQTTAPGCLRVKVTDTGIGMNPDEIAHVFDAFTQGVHHFGGLGLGLAISQKLIEQHRGSIRALSEGKGHGATFVIELPVLKTPNTRKAVGVKPVSVPPPAPPTSVRQHVLLVEDHEPTRTSLTQLLLRRRYKVTSAGSLAEARLRLKQDTFQILISDIGLPDGNGYELMAEIRQHHQLKGIALTGYGMEQDVARSQAAGFMTHLTKPVRIQALENALAQVVQAS